MKAVIIIPARYGSTRYPGKPLVELRTREGKKSLIQLSWEAANKVSGVSEIYIATDDKRTKLYGQSNTSFGGMSSISFGLEHNVYKSFNLGFDVITYPSNSYLEFDTKKGKNSSFKWYPIGEEGGSIFAPYLSIHF